MREIQIKDKRFRVSIPEEKILRSIAQIAEKIDVDYQGKVPLFICVLNGAFLFAADLLKMLSLECEISFVKLASYEGTASVGKVKTLIGLNQNIKGRDVVIVEDIVDTGLTIDTLYKQLQVFEPNSIKVATMMFKPDSYQKEVPIDYFAMEIPANFIVGYGLDYEERGRNLKNIYSLIQ